MKKLLGLAAILYLQIATFGQPACDPETGTAKQGTLPYTLNPFKNRATAPAKAQIISSITLDKVLATGNDTNRFRNSDGAVIEGYVFSTKLEGKESCNCESSDPKNRDFHIYVAKTPTETDKSKMMVVEITPKIRATKGAAWSPGNIAKLKGHKVKFTGWMFYDKEHENIALNTNPSGSKIVRATVWEIHPITDFKID